MIAVAAEKEAGLMNNDYDIAIVEDFQRNE
jgi:hypothetical protein